MNACPPPSPRRVTFPRYLSALTLVAASACASPPAEQAAPASPPTPAAQYLYLWTAASDSTQPDFLAVLDVTEDSVRYGRLVTTLPVPGRGNGPHHTEHELAADAQLFANGFASGQSFIFDLRDAASPRIAGQFGDVSGYAHPHSFLRLPNGNVLGTFQMQHVGGAMLAGGLVEMTTSGTVVRSSSANAPGSRADLRVYSAGIVPALDRIVTTTTDMDKDTPASRTLQLWRLSDLALLTSFQLPDGPAGNEGLLSAEPRLMADGKTLLVSTFNCGLYLVDGIDGSTPSARLVSSFPQKQGTYCAIPAISGHYYLVTVPAWNAVVSLDISDPAKPREVSRVSLGKDDTPHWLSVSPDQRRVVVTGYDGMQHRVVIARFDSTSGQLTLDERFKEEGATEPGFRMDNKTWPHGGSTKGVPHGAVFSRP